MLFRSQKQKQNNRNKNSNVGIARVRQRQFRLSSCAQYYLHALVNPFDVETGVCIPDDYELPSKKIRTLDRGFFTSGTQGVGFVIISPKGATNSSVTDVYTDSNYAGTVLTSDLSVVGVHGTATGQFPYSSADMTGGDLAVRLVSCGLRVRYIGTELNRSGRFILCRLPNTGSPANSFNAETPDTLATNQTNKTAAVIKRWQGLFFVPMEAVDFEYLSQDNAIPTDGSFGTLAIAWSGGYPGTQCEYEIVRHFEVIPRNGKSIDNITKSDSDTVGLSAIKNAVGTGIIDPTETSYNRLFSYISSYTSNDLSGYIDVASKAATAAKVVRSVF